jgi:replication fork protection complex subunit Tof1/Swi1
VPDGPLFPANIRTKSSALGELKEKRRKRHRQTEDTEPPLDDDQLEEQRRNGQANAMARQAKIKSDLYIHASDEETDEDADREFFIHEEERRKAQAQRVQEALLSAVLEDTNREKLSKNKGRKRRGHTGDGGSELAETGDRKRQRTTRMVPNIDDDTSDDDILMTGISMRSTTASPRRDRISTSHDEEDEDEDEDKDEAADMQPDTPPTSAEDDLEFDSHPDPDVIAPTEGVKASYHATAVTAPLAAGNDDDAAPRPPAVVPSRRRMRGAFASDTDSE